MALDVELAEIRDFLAQHAPFDSLPSGVLADLPRRLTVEYHRRGRSIIARGKDNHSLYVLRSGGGSTSTATIRASSTCEVLSESGVLGMAG